MKNNPTKKKEIFLSVCILNLSHLLVNRPKASSKFAFVSCWTTNDFHGDHESCICSRQLPETLALAATTSLNPTTSALSTASHLSLSPPLSQMSYFAIKAPQKTPQTSHVYAHKIHTSCFSSFHGRTPQPAPMTTREVTDGTAEEREKSYLKAINLLKPSWLSLLSTVGAKGLAVEAGGAGQGADTDTSEICYRVSSLAPTYILSLSRGS